MSNKPNSLPETSATPGTGAHLQSAGQHLLQAAREAAAGVGEAQTAARAALHDGLAAATPELGAARSEVREAGTAAAAQAQQQWQDLRQRSEGFVREHPLAALGIAAASGFLLSRLLRR
jgi:ElaB/YqjD/DUF883 family membrane-anchored ribosome-binding protein